MNDQTGLQLGVEQPDTEFHDQCNQSRPNHRGDQYLFERMARGEIDNAGAAHDFGKDEDECDGGQYQRLCPRTRVAQGLGNDNGNGEVEGCRQYLGSKGI